MSNLLFIELAPVVVVVVVVDVVVVVVAVVPRRQMSLRASQTGSLVFNQAQLHSRLAEQKTTTFPAVVVGAGRVGRPTVALIVAVVSSYKGFESGRRVGPQMGRPHGRPLHSPGRRRPQTSPDQPSQQTRQTN